MFAGIHSYAGQIIVKSAKKQKIAELIKAVRNWNGNLFLIILQQPLLPASRKEREDFL